MCVVNIFLIVCRPSQPDLFLWVSMVSPSFFLDQSCNVGARTGEIVGDRSADNPTQGSQLSEVGYTLSAKASSRQHTLHLSVVRQYCLANTHSICLS